MHGLILTKYAKKKFKRIKRLHVILLEGANDSFA